jgi:hypothetical protein
MKHALAGSLALAALIVVVMGAVSQQPPGRDKGDRKDGRQGGPPPRFQLGNLFPPHVKEELQLTKKQEKQLAQLEKSVKEKLEMILTAEQQKKIEAFRPPMPPGPPPGNQDPQDAGPPEDDDHGRPVVQVAKELGVIPEQFREAFKKVRPAVPGQEPTEE